MLLYYKKNITDGHLAFFKAIAFFKGFYILFNIFIYSKVRSKSLTHLSPSDVRVISAGLDETSSLSGYSQDGAIFSYEKTRLALRLVGFSLENVSKV